MAAHKERHVKMRSNIPFFNKISMQTMGMLVVIFIAIITIINMAGQSIIRNVYQDNYAERVLLTNSLITAHIDYEEIVPYIELLRQQDADFRQRQVRFHHDREELYRLQREGAPEEQQRQVLLRLQEFHAETAALKDDEYWRIIDELKDIKESGKLTYVYIVADLGLRSLTGEKLYTFVFDAQDGETFDNLSVDGLGTCNTFSSVMESVINRNGSLEYLTHSKDMYGELYEAYSAITDANGNTVAVLGSDLELSDMYDVIAAAISNFNVILLGFLTVTLVLIYFNMTYSIIRPLRSLTVTIEKFRNNEPGITVSKGVLKRRNEIGLLAAALSDAIEENRSLNHLESIMSSINAMICVINPETYELIFVNNEMRRVLGVSDDYEGKICYKTLRNFQGVCDFCPCRQLDKAPDKEVIWEQKDERLGRIYRTYSRYIKWNDGRRVQIQYGVDITDIVRMQNELVSQNMRMTMLKESMNIGMWDCAAAPGVPGAALDPGADVWWSAEYRAMLGYEEDDEFPDKLESWLDRIHADDANRVHAVLLRHLSDTSGSTPFDTEYRIRKKDGDYIWCRSFGTSLRDEKGIPVRVVGAMENISGRKKFERKIVEANKELALARDIAESANRAKSDFLATMSHEIRTPMNVILGLTEIELQNRDINPETKESLGMIYESGSLLLGIINDILDLSKIEAGKMEIIPANYSLPNLINDAVQINKLYYENTQTEFLLDIDADTPHNLFGDPLRIKQILNNILSNAFKYTETGEVKLDVFSEHVTDNKIILIFKVSDTGCGMTKQQLSRLFGEYVRFSNTGKNPEGTGLGMNITKRLVDLMGGEINVESTEKKGSVFTVRLPQIRTDDTVCGSELTENIKNNRYLSTNISETGRIIHEKMPYGSVLIVDDMRTNIHVARGMLLPYGLKIDQASGGTEAIEKVKAGNVYDIIFMDQMMPEPDGIETTGILRKMGYTHPVIALTANALIGQADIFKENGFDGYISKPIDSRELDLILNKFIRGRHGSGAGN